MRLLRGYGRGALLRGASPWGRRRSLPPDVRQTARFGCSARAATVLGYVVVLFGNGVGLLLADGIFGDLPGLSLGGRESVCSRFCLSVTAAPGPSAVPLSRSAEGSARACVRA